MKRRIERSRARCQQASLASKQKMRRAQSKEKIGNQAATTLRSGYHLATDK
jgi:hypothetical protein